MVACLAVVALASPQIALGVGPTATPHLLVSENFESASLAYATTPYDLVPGFPAGSTSGYWKTWIKRSHGPTGVRSLWCDGTNANAVGSMKYAQQSAGHATFPLTVAKDYYDISASFYYLLPSIGQSDQLAFGVQSSSEPEVAFKTYGELGVTGTTTWALKNATLTAETGNAYESMSRRSGVLRFQWADQKEPPGKTVFIGEGPSVDDVTIKGWKYGPVRSLAASSASNSITLSWSRPWRSTAATSTEERTISYRVWRAPAGSSAWVELTSSASRLGNAALSYTDATASSGAAYTYAVQAWDPGTGTQTGEYRQVSMGVVPRLVSATSIGATSVELRFNKPVNRASVAATDFRSSLRLWGIGRWSADGRRVRFSTTPQRPERTYTVSLRAGAIKDLYGNLSTSTAAVKLRR